MSNTVIDDPILFNGVDLNSIDGWQTTATDPYRYADRDLKTFDVVYSDNTVTTAGFFSGKSIHVTGVLKLSGRELLDTSISQLNRVLAPLNKTLRLPVAGELRDYYRCSVKNIVVTDVAGGYAAIDIEFRASDPYAYDTTSTTLLTVANLTSGNKSYPVTFDGIGDQAPVITLTLDSATNYSNRTVTFTNPVTDTYISIQRTWTAAEVLIIDNLNQTVTIGGEPVEYQGNFITWDSAAGFINYSDDFTARQVDISVTYIKRRR